MCTYELDLQNTQMLYLTVLSLNGYHDVLSPYLKLYVIAFSFFCAIILFCYKTLCLIWTGGGG